MSLSWTLNLLDCDSEGCCTIAEATVDISCLLLSDTPSVGPLEIASPLPNELASAIDDIDSSFKTLMRGRPSSFQI